MLRLLNNVIEFFIGGIEGDHEYQRRIRLIAYTIFLTGLFTLFYSLISLSVSFYYGVCIMLTAGVSFFTLLFLLKMRLNAYVIANLFGLIGIGAICGVIYFSGGFRSSTLPWVASTPIAILLIAGRRSGIFWCIVAIGAVLTFGILHYNGYLFPIKYDFSKELILALSSYSGLIGIIFIISIVFENVRLRAHRQVTRQKDELQQALVNLKLTQAQLVQAEKMASLGELTAGIAHEIQNPLNFINNFSEVNIELINELKYEVEQKNEGAVLEIAGDIEMNQQKINHHGKRADAIVKGMLQHSQSGTAAKGPVNINALAEEYLRLSFHGLKAIDQTFNATLKTSFDENLQTIEAVPQDIGRVLLNLYNNALYAINTKRKQEGSVFEPTLIVKTLVKSNEVQIIVKDNGTGIPQKVLHKIYQPFFTTKPTGEGTGLGLSLTYDIVKAHGGNLTVETRENEGSEFTVHLPYTNQPILLSDTIY